MFFTIESVKAFIVDLDSFQVSQKGLEKVLSVLTNYEIMFVSSNVDKSFADLPVNQSRIFRAETEIESLLFQNVIRKALTQCGVSRNETVFITMDHQKSLEAAQELLLGTVLYSPQASFDQNKLAIYQNMPDFIVHNSAELAGILDGQAVGHFAEFSVSERQLHPIKPKQNTVYHFELTTSEGIQVRFSGRYFKVEDARYHLHPLSLRIINAKRYPERHAETFANIFAHLIMWQTNGDFDLIAVVPPKPGQADRNGLYALELDKRTVFKDAKINNRVALDSLACIRDYGSLKASGGPAQRAEAIKGALKASQRVRGKKVVLLDDVYATGSTMNECIKTLRDAGAAQVFPIVLAYHPLHCTSLGKLEDGLPVCEKCKGKLVPRFKKSSGDLFYGCENFLQGEGHSMRQFVEVQRLRVKNSESKIMAPDEEVISWDVLF